MDLFTFKKTLSLFLHPLTLFVLVQLWACLLIASGSRPYRGREGENPELVRRHQERRGRRRRRGIGLLLLTLLVLVFFGSEPGSRLFYSTLGGRFPVIEEDDPELVANPPPFVVVLSGSYRVGDDVPISALLSGATMARVIEGVRLHRAFPETTLVFTGGGADEASSSAAAMKRFALFLGVDEASIVLEEASRDTKDHPKKLASILNDEPFFLVTSEVHLPRATALFHAAGYRFIAAPAEVREPEDRPLVLGDFLPRSSRVYLSHQVLHEWLGLIWARARGQIGPQEAVKQGKRSGEKRKEESDATEGGGNVPEDEGASPKRDPKDML